MILIDKPKAWGWKTLHLTPSIAQISQSEGQVIHVPVNKVFVIPINVHPGQCAIVGSKQQTLDLPVCYHSIFIHLATGVRCSAVMVEEEESTKVYKQSWIVDGHDGAVDGDVDIDGDVDGVYATSPDRREALDKMMMWRHS